MEDFKGTVLHFDEVAYTHQARRLTKLCSQVNDIACDYAALDSNFVFSQSTLTDLLTGGISSIAKQYAAITAGQISKLRFSAPALVQSLQSGNAAALEPLAQKIEALRGEVGEMDRPYIIIEDGKATLPEKTMQALKEHYSVIVRTDAQNELYNHLLTVKQAYEVLTAFMVQHGCPLHAWGDIISRFSNNALLYEGGAQLHITRGAINIKL